MTSHHKTCLFFKNSYWVAQKEKGTRGRNTILFYHAMTKLPALAAVTETALSATIVVDGNILDLVFTNPSYDTYNSFFTLYGY